jgi:hypothetical protein
VGRNTGNRILGGGMKLFKNRGFLEFFIEILIPIILFVRFMPEIAGPIWQKVEADPSTKLWQLVVMHILSIAMCICWIEAYNCIRIGLFPPKRRH